MVCKMGEEKIRMLIAKTVSNELLNLIISTTNARDVM